MWVWIVLFLLVVLIMVMWFQRSDKRRSSSYSDGFVDGVIISDIVDDCDVGDWGD